MTGEGECERTLITIPRRGVYVKHVESDAVVIDPNHMIFHEEGEVYRLSHPYGCGDDGVWIWIDDSLLRDLLASHDPEAHDRAAHFRAGSIPLASDLVLLERQLIRLLARSHSIERLEVEEALIHFVDRALERQARAGGVAPDRRARRSTRAAHAKIAERAQAFLAADPGARPGLDEIADAAHVSVSHLCRVFRRMTGSSLHAYQSRLRMRAGLDRVLDGEDNLTNLAFDLGYSSHSHFTNAFRREFGVTPSAVRDSSGRG
ncbi:MAG: helix-turn-helix transcriptional regulator [Phycisphaerales bacterium]